VLTKKEGKLPKKNLSENKGLGKNVPPKKSSKKAKTKASVGKKILIITLLCLFCLVLIGGVSVAMVVMDYIEDAPPYQPEKLKPAETSFIYDHEGNKLSRLHDVQDRKSIALEEIPGHVQDAFIAIEDHRFEDHRGVDPIGIARAAVINYQKDDIVQGASTLTQQLARNVFLSTEQTYERKIQEAWLALQIEEQFSKDDILEMYLNMIYFGNGVYGVKTAAEAYFDKEVGDLTLSEAAMLAGIPKSPNRFNPLASEEKAEHRMKLVLNQMEEFEHISTWEAHSARDTEEITYAEKDPSELPYPEFLEYTLHHELIDILMEMPKYENRKDAYQAVYSEGLHIFTTLNTDLQEHVQDTLNRDEMYPQTLNIDMGKFLESRRESGRRIPFGFPESFIDNEDGVPQPQSTFVLADPSTGRIMALGAGRDFEKGENEVLRYLSKRQPGSAIKPIVSYVPALEEKQMSAGSIVYDEPFSRGNYTPRSWDGQFWGAITIREALRWSRNIPAVALLNAVSPYKGTEYASKMGIESFSEADRHALAVALGGVSGIPPLEMAQAYATLANQGEKIPLHTVTHIKDRYGNIVYKNKGAGKSVISPETAYQISDILEDAHRNTFTADMPVATDRPVAAKTGTTDGDRDTYLAAYTPNLVSIFWMGYDFKDMGRIRGGHNLSTSFTREVFNKALEVQEEKTFAEAKPSGLQEIDVCTSSGLRATGDCREAGNTNTDYFNPGSAPSRYCFQCRDD